MTDSRSERERMIEVLHTSPITLDDVSVALADGTHRLTTKGVQRLVDALEAAGLVPARTWVPTRWWRSVEPDGSLWGESSDEEEVREMALERHTIQQLWSATEVEWRDAPKAA
jgi:hypothetical protein